MLGRLSQQIVLATFIAQAILRVLLTLIPELEQQTLHQMEVVMSLYIN